MVVLVIGDDHQLSDISQTVHSADGFQCSFNNSFLDRVGCWELQPLLKPRSSMEIKQILLNS